MFASISGRFNTLLLALLVLMAVTIIGILATRAGAGPLDPPGTPGPTLPQVEPRTPVQSLPGSASAQYLISQPGSYFLTGNVTGVASKDAIDITTDDMTLDLNGFTILGASGSNYAISDGGPAHVRWTIHNGVIDSSWVRGISAPNVSDSVFRDLIINGATNAALMAGSAIRASNITAQANAFNGLIFGADADISDCFADTSVSAQNAGVAVGDQSTVVRCSTTGPFNTGISLGPASRLTDCDVRFAQAYGVFAFAGVSVRSCTVGGTGQIAIGALDNASIVDNVVDTAVYGIYLIASSIRVEGNQIQHTTDGVITAGGSTSNLIIGNRLRDIANPIVTGCCSQVGAVVGANSGNADANVAY